VSVVTKKFQYGQHEVTLETGLIAKQATGSVMVSMGDTVVLVTAVASKTAPEGRDFFPLTVVYQERTYAAGNIPGGFFKREGKPTEKEVLTSRLIDRPLRPLFPGNFFNDVQVVATVLSIDPEIDSDIPAIIGASAALAVSGIPFNGPIAAARVGYRDGEYILNLKVSDLETSQLDLVVAGTESAVLMVESEAKELSEEVMLGAVMFGHQQMQVVINAIKAFASEGGNTDWQWQPPEINTSLQAQVKQSAETQLADAYLIKEKPERQAKLATIREQVLKQLVNEEQEQSPNADDVVRAIDKLEKTIVRTRVLNGENRIDGRDHRTVRPIAVKTGILPRTHGSALFTRGETQAIVVATLGTDRDAQIIDGLTGERRDRFMLHYNFPPYCVGETGMMTGPKRREIGHGRLARRGIEAVLPPEDECPYVIRVVSEITESNGSSSMASVCGTSLALMDAGVPVKAPVAGIAMGLVKEGDNFVVLSDILGDEDHLGDMDFKVAGTETGITALQMDIKIDGITEQIMKSALEQAKEGRLHILSIMNACIKESRTHVSAHAPRIISVKVNPDKIRDIIGKGGATIRAITEETGASVDIDDSGNVTIASVNSEAGLKALRKIESLTAEVEVGKIYEGKVVRVMDFGAFVNILPGKDGLLHISEIAAHRIENIHEEVKEGEGVQVKVLEIDRQGRIRLSKRAIVEAAETDEN